MGHELPAQAGEADAPPRAASFDSPAARASAAAPKAAPTPEQVAERIRAVLERKRSTPPAPPLAPPDSTPAPAVVAPAPAPALAPAPVEATRPLEPTAAAAPVGVPELSTAVRAPRRRLAARGPERASVLEYARTRLGVWYSSITFHVFLLAVLGFFTLAQRTSFYEHLFPGGPAPPVHRVRLRSAEPPRVDADRADRPSRQIDLWNTPGEGPGGTQHEGGQVADHDESADGEDYHQLKGGEHSVEGLLGIDKGWGGSEEDAPGVKAASIGVGAGLVTRRSARSASGAAAARGAGDASAAA